MDRHPRARGAFVGIIRELRPAISEADLLAWWVAIVKPVIDSTEYNKDAQSDAREFSIGVMVKDDDEDDTAEHIASSDRICREMLNTYVARNRPLTEEDEEGSAADNAQVATQVEDILISFGRKRPRTLFHWIDDLVRRAATRLIALKLLSSFVRIDTPHLYLVINTPLVEDLLKCLMNDTATEVLSVSLKSLIMLLPHIPGSLSPYLPRLFLIYSRLLCWEKFSEFNTEAQRSVVTDNRISLTEEDEDDYARDVGLDSNWEKVRPAESTVESATPEVMTYFTFLYGLYPLNLANYIRKPRRYLKDIEFPSADSFDLDQAVIRSRTDQFRAVHFLHPNFYNMTIDEELTDPKWPKMDPADVVGECHSLCMYEKAPQDMPGPPPTKKLPAIPYTRPRKAPSGGELSPAASHISLRSGTSWRDTKSTTTSTTGDAHSPVLRPHVTGADVSSLDHEHTSPPRDNLAYLQREMALLQSDLNFERWHKAQYSSHISKIFQRNIKEATREAETLNLIMANRALQKQLERMREAREATQKDAALTRKQANTLEANMMERFNKMRIEQATWKADADELQRLRSEMHEYRDLLVASEARELKKSFQVQISEQELEKMQKLTDQLKTTRQELRTLKYEQSEYAIKKKENELMDDEHNKMQNQMHSLEQEHARMRHAYATKIAELETQLGIPGSSTRRSSAQYGADIQVVVRQAIAESEGKLAQLKKSYSKLVADHTDLELEYQSLRTRLEVLHGGASAPSVYSVARNSFDYDIIDDYRDASLTRISTSEPPPRCFRPLLPTPSMTSGSGQTSVNEFAGLMFDPRASRKNSTISGTSSQPAAFNQSAPLGQDEDTSAFSDYSGSGSQGKKEKIQPDSSVRVYGRGTLNNISDNL